MSPFVVEAFDFVLFLHFYKDEKHMHLATIWSVLIKCLTWKENIEGDGQRFHQKNKQQLLTSNHWAWKRSWNMDIWRFKARPWLGTGIKYVGFVFCSTNKLQRCAIKHIHWSVICNFANYRLLSYLTLVCIY
jgi:hypothetical protein